MSRRGHQSALLLEETTKGSVVESQELAFACHMVWAAFTAVVTSIKRWSPAALVRADKSDVLTEDLIQAEKRVDSIKHTCACTHKRILSCLHNVSLEDNEKLQKKVPELALFHSLQECHKNVGSQTLLGSGRYNVNILSILLSTYCLDYQILFNGAAGDDTQVHIKRCHESKKKVPELALFHSLQECHKNVGSQTLLGVLGWLAELLFLLVIVLPSLCSQVLLDCAGLQQRLGQELLNYERETDRQVLQPTNQLLECGVNIRPAHDVSLEYMPICAGLCAFVEEMQLTSKVATDYSAAGRESIDENVCTCPEETVKEMIAEMQDEDQPSSDECDDSTASAVVPPD
ncbi:hypothetical protein HPB51_020675 [Rhipicephalus microplus]|uniref:Uncharacterized protein n=1 Tax=Rhipicephalus microplus TaxID=6941 RepID=A0A9J6EUK4_RHIMP|nr:hypothetical protein HPB51_020675 [Rhipicephalus microplus]